MARRTDLGSDWSEVVARWYLGQPPPVSGEQGWSALGVLERLYPEHLDELVSQVAIAPALMASAVETGLMLAACEALEGFDELLGRIRAGERGAMSEAVAAAAFVSLGHTPDLGPSLGGRRLDMRVAVEAVEVYVEVTAPEFSDEVRDVRQRITELSDRLAEENRGRFVDVYLLADPTSDVSDDIAEILGESPAASSGAVHELPDTAFIRYEKFQADKAVLQPIPAGAGPPLEGVVAIRLERGVGTRVNVRIAVTDERAERLMKREARHFSRDEANLLVMDVTRVAGGIQLWAPLVQRRFQPAIHRRFGAVVLFSAVVSQSIVVRRWRVLANPYALKPVPASLLRGLETYGDVEVQPEES